MQSFKIGGGGSGGRAGLDPRRSSLQHFNEFGGPGDWVIAEVEFVNDLVDHQRKVGLSSDPRWNGARGEGGGREEREGGGERRGKEEGGKGKKKGKEERERGERERNIERGREREKGREREREREEKRERERRGERVRGAGRGVEERGNRDKCIDRDGEGDV